MLSTTSDHALRAVLVLARHYGQRPVRANEIAELTATPQNYLGKTLNALAKAGVVRSSRGPTGGFTLAQPPHLLTIAQVVDCFDEPRPQSRCMLGASPCDPMRPCAAHSSWTALKQAQRAPLANTTVDDLLHGRVVHYAAPMTAIAASPTSTAVAA
jgi:Rrf2 family protein